MYEQKAVEPRAGVFRIYLAFDGRVPATDPQVSRVSAGHYAVSARGFNNAIGNKLLVLIEGRTGYSPVFSGVFRDQRDLLPQDVGRIEVISGRGGTLWGSNAAGGVINIITRRGGYAGSLGELSGERLVAVERGLDRVAAGSAERAGQRGPGRTPRAGQ